MQEGHHCHTECDAGSRGPSGENGKPVSTPVPTGVRGSDGSTSIERLSDQSRSSAMAPIAWLCSYLHAAERDFINNDRAGCAEKITWLAQLLMISPDSPDFGFVWEKVRSISDTMQRGLDVFGRNANYVPRLSYEFIRENVDRDLRFAQSIELALASARNRDIDQRERRATVERTIDSVRNRVEGMRQSIRNDFGTKQNVQTEVAGLRVELDKIYAQLMSASESFKSAVARRSGGCGFSDVLNFASMVATVVAVPGAGLTAFSAASTAWTALQSRSHQSAPGESWFDGLKAEANEIGKIVKPAGDSIRDFGSAYNQAMGEIATVFGDRAAGRVPGTPSNDYAKLLANKQSFDKEIEPFLNMAEAREYKRLMDLFVDTSETRNNKILEHDMLVQKIWKTWADIRVVQSDVAAATASLDYDFELESQVHFLDRTLTGIKWNSLRSISSMVKAIEYLTGDRIDIVYDDSTVAAVESVATNVNQQYLQVLDALGRESDEAENLQMPLKDVLTDDALERLKRGEAIVFSLRPQADDLFAGRYAVKASRIALRFRDGNTPRGIRIAFEQCGRSVIRDRNGNLSTYSHTSVPVAFQINREGEVISGGRILREGESPFVGVSPYGPWKMQIFGDQREREKALSAKLVFDVRSQLLPIPNGRRPAHANNLHQEVRAQVLNG
jgi:hypothetical protein